MAGTLINSQAARPTPGRRGNQSVRTAMPTVPSDYSYQSRPVSLAIEAATGKRRLRPAPDIIKMTSLDEGIDGAQTTMRLTAGLNIEDIDQAGSIGKQHFADLFAKFSADRLVVAQIVPPPPAIRTAHKTLPLPLFSGYPMEPEAFADGSRQSFTVTCVSEADETLATDPGHQITGRYMLLEPHKPYDPTRSRVQLVSALSLAYNANNKPNRLKTHITKMIGGKAVEVYVHTSDGDPDAVYWNYSDALRNLLLFWVVEPGSLVSVADFFEDSEPYKDAPPAPGLPDPFARSMSRRVEDVSLRSMSVKDALTVLCNMAGLHYQLPFRYRASAAAATTSATIEQWLRLFAVLGSDGDEAATPQRAMISPRVRDLPRQSPFTDVTGSTARRVIEDNRAGFDATLTQDRRVINRPHLVGATRLFEVSLVMRPGWLPRADLDDVSPANIQQSIRDWEDQFDPEFDLDGVPNSPFHSRHPEFLKNSDVLRLWVFPDSTRYVGAGLGRSTLWTEAMYSPYLQPTPAGTLPSNVLLRNDIGGGIPSASTWVPRNRRLLDMIGRDTLAQDQAPVVRLHFGMTSPTAVLGQTGWVRYMGRTQILKDRCGFMLMDDDLVKAVSYRQAPNDVGSLRMVDAFIRGTFAVSVTCSIEGDQRMAYLARSSASSLSRNRSKILDVSDRFKSLSRRGQNSYLNKQDGDEANFEDRDDAVALKQYGDRWADQLGVETVSGPVRMPWIDNAWSLGDSFFGSQGMGIGFASYPQIVRRTIAFDPESGYSTTYSLSDLRHSPELST